MIFALIIVGFLIDFVALQFCSPFLFCEDCYALGCMGCSNFEEIYCEERFVCDEGYVQVDCDGNPFTPAPPPPPPTPPPTPLPTPRPPTPVPPTPKPPTPFPTPNPSPATATTSCDASLPCQQCVSQNDCVFCLTSNSCVTRQQCAVTRQDNQCQSQSSNVGPSNVITQHARTVPNFVPTPTPEPSPSPTSNPPSSSTLVIVLISIAAVLIVCGLLALLAFIVLRRRREQQQQSVSSIANNQMGTSMHIMSSNVAYNPTATTLPSTGSVTPVSSTQALTSSSATNYSFSQGIYSVQQPYSATMPEQMRPYAENGVARPGAYVCGICQNAYATEYDVMFHHQKRHPDMGEARVEARSYSSNGAYQF